LLEPVEIEDVPDEDEVSRAFFRAPVAPDLDLDPESHFVFGPDKSPQGREKKKYERAESVYWRKYAVTNDAIHSRGCALEVARNERLRSKGKETVAYAGFGTGKVRAIRSVRTRAYRLSLIHHPENGDSSHAHILIHDLQGENVKSIPQNDQRELVGDLFRLLVPVRTHKCK
jgi:hypothetical protein